MVIKSLGLIETVGLVAAFEAADAALKAANIELIGYELTNGGGLVLLTFSGDVGAIKVAVAAGTLAASNVNKVAAAHVIPRPHQQLSSVLTVKENPNRKVHVATEMAIDIQQDDESKELSGVVSSDQEGKNLAGLCNFCRDPACHRKKGDPKVTCIHYGKNNEEAE